MESITIRYLRLLALLLTLLLVTSNRAHAAPPPQTPDATLRIINDSDQTICYVYLSPVTASTRGDDWLSDDMILPGENYSVDLSEGDYNVFLGDCEGSVLLARAGIVISGLYELHLTGSELCKTLGLEGMGLYRQAQYPEALQKLQNALECYQEVNDSNGERLCLVWIGKTLEYLGQHQEALRYYEQALHIAREIGDHTIEGDILHNIGLIFEHLGQYQEALRYYEQALRIAREIGDRARESATLNNIGVVYELKGQYGEALGYYEEVLYIVKETGDRYGEGYSLNNIGSIYDDLGQYEEALGYFEESLRIRQEIGDRAGEGESLNNIGFIYERLGMYQEALGYFEESLRIRQEIGDRRAVGGSLNNIGFIYDRLGQYEKALRYYEQALHIKQEMGDRRGAGGTFNNIGGIYERLGLYQEALGYYEQALGIQQEIGNRAAESVALNNLGNIYSHLEQHGEALRYYEQALHIQQEIGDRAGEGASLSNIGGDYDSLGQYEEALGYYEQALSVQQEIGNRAAEGVVLNNLGKIYFHLGQYEEALGHYEQALHIMREVGDRAGKSVALGNTGFIYHSLKEYEQALGYYKQAIFVIEMMRGEMTVGEIKSGFAAEWGFVYDHIIALLTQMARSDEAFDYVQRAKARTFLDQLANVRIAPRATDDTNLLAREQELLDQIRALEGILAGRSDLSSLDATTRDSPSPLTGEQRQELQARLDAAYREYEQLLIQIKLTNPQYASLRSVQASTLIAVQQTLPPSVTLLEYYVTPDQTYAFVVTQDGLNAVPISVTEKALKDSIAWFRQFLSLEGVPQASQELYDTLFAPVREHIHTDVLYIAPHGVLHYLPFGALHDGDHYLVEGYTIAYLPSASVLQYVLANVHNDVGGDLLALCNPEAEGAPYLNYAVAETEAIAALFNARVIVGPEATETWLLDQAPQASLVHIAAHGQFNPVAPQFSRIYLAPDDENDGYLEVHEIFSLELPQTDLVTLSACETQLGGLSAGDELVGLSRAFIYAGTPSVVASLWRVEDRTTALLMERFYAHLREGMGKAAALRQAQLDLRADYPNPRYWAAFVLSGDGGESATAQRLSNPFYRALSRLHTLATWLAVWVCLILFFGCSLAVILVRGPLEPVKVEHPTRPHITLVRKPRFPTWARRLAGAVCAVTLTLVIILLLTYTFR